MKKPPAWRGWNEVNQTMSFQSMTDMEKTAEELKIPLWKAVMEDDRRERQVSVEDTMTKMQERFHAMKRADVDYEEQLCSWSGLSGADGGRMQRFVRQGKAVSGSFMGAVIAGALKMGESNACMKRIVAAPTAGACGVVPAVFLAYQQFFGIPDKSMLEGMFLAAGIGQVIAERASISGAQGGCQAEIGSASAMCAGALTHIRGGNTIQIFSAGAFAMKSLLGLVCDPLGGLVEIPCIRRNVIGAVNAVACSDMAMAGISTRVPFDEVIDAMGEIGEMMPGGLKETSQAGLAATVTGKRVALDLSQRNQTPQC